MNDNTAYTKEYAEAHQLLGLVEILDADGEPTGFYEAGPSEAAPTEATEFVAEDASDHVVTVH